jgi:hypothetical protein
MNMRRFDTAAYEAALDSESMAFDDTEIVIPRCSVATFSSLGRLFTLAIF